jgi:hypothetical protein
MANQNSYKRTVAGSVGAGIGAIFNGSGRTYYILEHKTTSKYHNAGESQKIIIDQIEMGRDSSCQVRFDESFETVSRKHAAIVRDGENWQLVNLSNSNPTLVNGQPIQGHYYLQSGDEIQLSVGGPRLGFIVPQGKQGLTSSIRLTERMNLFRQQALAPYRRAIWILSTLLVLAIVGFGAWNYKLSLDNQELRKEMMTYQSKLDSLSVVKQGLLDEQAQLNQELESGVSEARKKEIQQRIVYVNRQLTSVASEAKRYQEEIDKAAQRAVDEGMDEEDITTYAPSATNAIANSRDNVETTEESSEATSGEAVAGAGAIETNATAHGDASVTIRDYYQHIYTLKLKSISVEYQGRSFDPGISLSNVICGTAFVLSNGTLVTARQNIEPWIFWRELGGEWRKLMAEYVSLGCNVILEYDAYSTAGTAKKLSFSNQDFLIDRSGDVTTEVIEIGKEVRVHLRENGIDLSSREFRSRSFIFFSPTSSCYALLKGKGGVGIPYDAGASLSSDGGTEVQVAGFKGNPDIHNLEGYISYFKSSTSRTDTQNGTIVLQDANSNAGYLGSPAFVKEEDGTYRVIGLMVGKLFGEDRIVPIANCN